MFNDSPFVRVYRSGRTFAGGAWWAVLAPGLFLVLMGLAILIWPELLAYMVATVLLGIGASLSLWGWSLRRVEKRAQSDGVVYRMM